MPMITKTSYLSFVHCPKRFWLNEFQPNLATPPDPTARRRLMAGQEVDKLARERFDNGRLIPYRPHPTDMVPLTTQAIDEGAEALFQATFTTDDLLVKVDVLQKMETGWHLIEVKSGTSYKAGEHLPDVAFQVYVLQSTGLNVTKASLMHLNRECRHPNLSNLFVLTDVTEDITDYLPQVGEDTAVIRQLLSQSNKPNGEIGRHCTKPHICHFYDHCWQDVNGLTIYDIPRLSVKRERPLQEAGVLYLPDIPADYPITATQRKFVEFFVRKQVNIDRASIQQALADLTFPLYFFDFETIDYAIPVFDGCKPYQQVPFQYSCHVLHADGTLTHHDYLHTDGSDPRLPLTNALLKAIGDDEGNIIVYFATFEKQRLLELAEAFPEHAPRLLNMVDRLWDQLNVFKMHYRDYRFGKSNSLKSVLPVVVPALSYKALDVQDGTQAQVAWEEMIGVGETAVKTQLAKQLREYCHLDTLAMVEMHRALSNL